jgi:hypothetical protein
MGGHCGIRRSGYGFLLLLLLVLLVTVLVSECFSWLRERRVSESTWASLMSINKQSPRSLTLLILPEDMSNNGESTFVEENE